MNLNKGYEPDSFVYIMMLLLLQKSPNLFLSLSYKFRHHLHTHTRNLMVGAPSPSNLTEVSCAPAMPCHGTLTTWKPKNQSTKKPRQHLLVDGQHSYTTLFLKILQAMRLFISICPVFNMIDTLNQPNMWRGFGSTINTVPYPPPTFHPTSTLPCGSRKPPPACISWNSATRTWMPLRP